MDESPSAREVVVVASGKHPVRVRWSTYSFGAPAGTDDAVTAAVEPALLYRIVVVAAAAPGCDERDAYAPNVATEPRERDFRAAGVAGWHLA